jgi:hypothetical protein
MSSRHSKDFFLQLLVAGLSFATVLLPQGARASVVRQTLSLDRLVHRSACILVVRPAAPAISRVSIAIQRPDGKTVTFTQLAERYLVQEEIKSSGQRRGPWKGTAIRVFPHDHEWTKAVMARPPKPGEPRPIRLMPGYTPQGKRRQILFLTPTAEPDTFTYSAFDAWESMEMKSKILSVIAAGVRAAAGATGVTVKKSTVVIEFRQQEHGRDRLPAYAVKIRDTGEVIFTGLAHTRVKGKKTKRVPREAVAELARRMEAAGFLTWDATEPMRRGSIVRELTLTVSDKTHQITFGHSDGSPRFPVATIHRLVAELFALIQVDNWI